MYTVLTNSRCQVFLLSERIVSYKFGTCILIRLTYRYAVWNISVIKMDLHSERIILLSMFYKAYLNVYCFYYSIVSWLDYNSLLSLSSPSKI